MPFFSFIVLTVLRDLTALNDIIVLNDLNDLNDLKSPTPIHLILLKMTIKYHF